MKNENIRIVRTGLYGEKTAALLAEVFGCNVAGRSNWFGTRRFAVNFYFYARFSTEPDNEVVVKLSRYSALWTAGEGKDVLDRTDAEILELLGKTLTDLVPVYRKAAESGMRGVLRNYDESAVAKLECAADILAGDGNPEKKHGRQLVDELKNGKYDVFQTETEIARRSALGKLWETEQAKIKKTTRKYDLLAAGTEDASVRDYIRRREELTLDAMRKKLEKETEKLNAEYDALISGKAAEP